MTLLAEESLSRIFKGKSLQVEIYEFALLNLEEQLTSGEGKEARC